MSEDIPFDRRFDQQPGQVEQVTPRVRRILAPNPSPYTFTGTCSYVVGTGKVAIIDPGPDDAEHIAALLDAVRGEDVTHILVTHTHKDHSPAAAALKAVTGALTVAEGPHRPARPLHIGEVNPLDASADLAFEPDLVVADDDAVTGPGWTLSAVTTPGHAANHCAFSLEEDGVLFSGDHVMGWATSIVAPPDGAMGDYIRSLEKVGARPERVYLPGHGGAIQDAPAFVGRYLEHRFARETAILRALERDSETIPDLVRGIYIGLDPKLVGAASLTVLAHLEHLVAEGRVVTEGPASITGRYRLAA